MWKDTIVEEVRGSREEYASQFDYDLEAMGKDLQAKEKRHASRLVHSPARGKHVPNLPEPSSAPPSF